MNATKFKSVVRLPVFVTILSICGVLAKAVRTDEELLLSYLFANYDPSARPVLNSSKTVNVHLQYSLLQIQELNVRNQILATTGLLILDWVDERLRWDKDEANIDELVVDSAMIWKPEFAVINGADEIYRDYSEFHAVIYSDGAVRWEPGGVFKTMCQIDITYYPFDEQKCELIFGAWSYYTTKMNLTTTKTTVNLDTSKENGEWIVKKSDVKRSEFYFQCCPDQRFSNIVCAIHLRRRYTFYILNVILPGILTSAVLLSIFFCIPAQKVHIGVAALLSFRLFLLNVADTIPRTSDHVPLLGIYLTSTMAITTLAMVATVFVLNLHGMKEKPVPRWAKHFFILYLRRILCMCNCAPEQDITMETNQLNETLKEQDKKKIEYKFIESRLEPDGRVHAKLELSNPMSSSRLKQASQNCHSREERKPLLVKRDDKPTATPDFSKDWMQMAAVCDRLFFCLCLFFICLTTLLLFHPLTTSKYFNIPLVKLN